jgi:hypothetical protein
MQEKLDTRLDSWKEIAEYLGRNTRTVARWEQEKGLPVHRVPGGQRNAVFAYTGELDAWLRGEAGPGKAEAQPGSDEFQLAQGKSEPAKDRSLPEKKVTRHEVYGSGDSQLAKDSSHLSEAVTLRERKPIHTPRLWSITALTATVMLIGTLLYLAGDRPREPLARVSYENGKVTAWNEKDQILWTREFPYCASTKMFPRMEDLNGDGKKEVLFLSSPCDLSRDETGLYVLSSAGKELWHLTAHETFQFGSQPYGPEWWSEEWGVQEAANKKVVLVEFHHQVWWPSFLVALDGRGQLLGKFVNAGWIRATRWTQGPEGLHLLIGGISNSNDCGMLAVLDGNHPSGSSPERKGSDYECRNCPAGKPLKYFLFPRSELNVVTGLEHNRVVTINMLKDGIDVRTSEFDITSGGGNETAAGVYEFSPDLKLRRASYGDKYWELHRQLELEGKIRHSKAQCPDRHGPRLVRVWEPTTGWSELRLN